MQLNQPKCSWSRPARRVLWLQSSLPVCFMAAAVMCVTCADIVQAAEPSGKDSNVALWAALITVAGSVAGVIMQLRYNGREARRVEKIKAEAEQKERQRELALKIADLAGKDRAAARRFAIGLVKVEEVYYDEKIEKSSMRGKVFFIPVNSRFSVGRDKENDICLVDPDLPNDLDLTLSRYQCGFVADQHEVVVEDFNSANGTLVSDPKGNEVIDLKERGRVKFVKVQQRKLIDGDRIWIGPFILRFVKLQENKILL